jgi:hypothetical protein
VVEFFVFIRTAYRHCIVRFAGAARVEEAVLPLERHALGIDPKICSIVLVTSTAVLPTDFIALMIL